MMSVAHTAVIQMQDILGTGEQSRMNTPGKLEGNWQWRMSEGDISIPAARLADLTVCYGRAK